jgi:hypothetical protein
LSRYARIIYTTGSCNGDHQIDFEQIEKAIQLRSSPFPFRSLSSLLLPSPRSSSLIFVNRPEHHLSRLLILKHLERLRRLIKPVKPVANKALFALDLLPVLLLSSLRGRRLGRPPADITEEDVLVPTEAFEGVGEDGSDGATAKGGLERSERLRTGRDGGQRGRMGRREGEGKGSANERGV